MLVKLFKDLIGGGASKSSEAKAFEQDKGRMDYVSALVAGSPDAVRDALDYAELLIGRNEHSAAAELLDQILVASPRDQRAIALIARNPVPYSPHFYDAWLPGMLQSGQHMLGYLFSHHRFNRVIDFGAGAGAWLTAAGQCGARQLVGLEGAWAKAVSSELIDRSIEFRYGDLNDGGFLATANAEQFDLAICVEVAEHVDPDRSESLISSICSSAPTVVFGAALPRQWGNGHINCRSQGFWIDLFSRQGYRCVDFFRPQFWFHSVVRHWYAQNTFLFVSEASPEVLRSHQPQMLLDVYHPGTVNPFVLRDHSRGVVDPNDMK